VHQKSAQSELTAEAKPCAKSQGNGWSALQRTSFEQRQVRRVLVVFVAILVEWDRDNRRKRNRKARRKSVTA
jgi:hypothetical protein